MKISKMFLRMLIFIYLLHYLQTLAAVCAHSVSISIGMCQGYSAILIPQLISSGRIIIDQEQSSWLGKCSATNERKSVSLTNEFYCTAVAFCLFSPMGVLFVDHQSRRLRNSRSNLSQERRTCNVVVSDQVWSRSE